MPIRAGDAGREAMRRMMAAEDEEAELQPDGELSEGKLAAPGKGGVVLRIEIGPEDDEAFRKRMRGLRGPPVDLEAEPEI